jgi:WD40 repeat protein
MLTGSHDDTVQLWDTQTIKKVGPPLRHGGFVMCVDFSPDGRTLITGAADRTVRLWNLSDCNDRILRHQGNILGMAFSPSGNYVVTIGEDRLARVWDARTARQLTKPMLHDSPIQTLAISPDGKTLVTASSNQVLRWTAKSGEPMGEPWKFDGEVRKVDFSADGTTMLVQSVNDKHQTIELRSFPNGEARVKSLEFSSDSLLLASSSDKQSIIMTDRQGPMTSAAQIWSFQSGQTAQHSLKHESFVTAAAFSRDGRRAVTVGRDQSVRVWDARSGNEEFVYKHNGIVKDVCISDDGSTVLTGSNDKTARLWDAHTNLALGSPMKHPDQVSKVALTPDGRLAVTICDDGSAYLWDVFSCKLVTQPMQFDVGVVDCAIGPDGSAILFRCTDGSARLYDISRPVPGKLALIHAWALAHSGFQVDDSFEPRQLTQAEWLDAEKEVRSLESIGTVD